MMSNTTTQLSPTQSADAMLRVEKLTAGYDRTVLLRDVTFAIPRGQIVFIVGGSGCGKSTLLKNIIGQNEPLSGEVWINGQDFTQAEGSARELMMRQWGMMYQSGALFGSMTLLQNVMLPLEEFTALTAEMRVQVARMKLAQVGLLDRQNHFPAEISGGMKKRAAIARAMALDPEILFLDEPSAGLDPVTSASLDALIVRLSRSLGITVVIISHELASIESIADRVIFLSRSVQGVLADGTVAELKQSAEQSVRDFFNRTVQTEEP